jgi:hypothetical protein
MSLADRALTAIPAALNNYLTCHVATWFWAAEEATARGLTGAKQPLIRAGNIGALPTGAQTAMTNLVRVGTWDFNAQGMPAPGMVMLWTVGATHSAISTPAGITGYNQACVFAPYIVHHGYTMGLPAQVQAAKRVCYLIATDTVVNAAAAANL